MSRICCFVALLLVLQNSLWAQIVGQTPQQSAQSGDPDNPPSPDKTPQATKDGDSISWKTVLPKIWQDQRDVYWHYPKSLAEGHDWVSTAAFLAATGTLIAVDQFESPYFRRTTAFDGFNSGLSGMNSSLVIAAVPAATYLIGFVEKDTDAQRTALFTGEALADSEVAAELLKLVTRRSRPESIQPNGNFADTWADSRTVTDGSFPSAHTIAAFSVATVMSRHYGRNHKWVPYVAYGMAATIGFSRVTLSAHNVSDVFAGAALGYAISRFVVLGHHHHQ